jgi:LPS-assembly lipoprotein
MRFAHALIVLSVAVALGGCGFRPLYGSSPDAAGVSASLASVAIPEADTRVGQLVRNDLLAGRGGATGGDRYTLNMTTVLRKSGVIQQPQPSVTRQAIRLAVDFELTDSGTGKTVYSGKTFSQASYDVIRQPFADMQAETNAAERAAHEVSADIRTRLAAYFSAHPAAQ